jgi:hypothetical protein
MLSLAAQIVHRLEILSNEAEAGVVIPVLVSVPPYIHLGESRARYGFPEGLGIGNR